VAFTSDESHYSIAKGANWLGIGMENVVKVKSDARGRMIAAELNAQISKAKEAGKVPFFVNATSGTTVIGGYDDIEAIAEVTRKHDVWLHVDACWGGSVILSRQLRHLMKVRTG
jgi:sulfinoalanine decarboxylase/aspartate 1-decarboxylase